MRYSRLLALALVLTACSLPEVVGVDGAVPPDGPFHDGGRDAADGRTPDANVDANVDASMECVDGCDDGDACTTDTCTDGECVFEPVETDDSDACTTDVCTDGDVTHEPIEGCCATTDDCSGADLCIDGFCRPASCSDGMPNGTETDTDCGGDECAPCDLGLMCGDGSDCASALCPSGVCVECVAASDCPGTDSECGTRTCGENVCGIDYVAAGTLTSSQTMGDCQRNVCDGAGASVPSNDDTDVPNDSNPCTSDVCTAGAPSHELVAEGTSCGGAGLLCDDSGNCVGCLTASDCAGIDDECKTRTCLSNTCGFDFEAFGTPVAAQTNDDCSANVCDGVGNTVPSADPDDFVDDGNQCTADMCTTGTTTTHTNVAVGTPCSQGGGSMCNGAGACVQCVSVDDCSGTDDECGTRTCTAGMCGRLFAAAGTLAGTQSDGDCHQSQCDGAGNIVNAVANGDVPVDGNQCTGDVCVAGVASNPSSMTGTTCNQSGGTVCDGTGNCVSCVLDSQCPSAGQCEVPHCTAGSCGTVPAAAATACTGGFCDGTGSCVECLAASQCPGTDTECRTRTCSFGFCGFAFEVAGLPVSGQTSGDCHQRECDGSGSIVNATADSDLPVDGNQCTADLCTAGVPSNPSSSAGTACNQGGGTQCNGSGACIAPTPPTVVSTTPADGTSAIASTTIAVTFSAAMNPATLTAQTALGACSGSIQVSNDGFASCVAFASASATMSGGNTVATLTAAPGLLVNRTYRIRVTTAAQSASSVPLAAQFTMPSGFQTSSPVTASTGVVIAQVYGGGGSGGAVYPYDYVVIHNRGATSVNLAGWTLQYSAATSTTAWTPFALTGSIASGAYYMIRGSGSGAAVPTPEVTASSLAIQANNARVALVSSAAALPAGCPAASAVVDLVGFGTANCFEGAAAPAPSVTNAIFRAGVGCTDTNVNSADFSTGAPAPLNTASTAVICSGVGNETGSAVEADYCTVQFPLSLSASVGTPVATVYGQIFEATVTESAGAAASVVAQLGYGVATANPQYEAGWVWTNAAYNTQSGSNDEYQATFTAPVVAGSYRYAYRFSVDGGGTWTYCDANSGDAGAGSNAGLTFDLTSLPVLTVSP